MVRPLLWRWVVLGELLGVVARYRRRAGPGASRADQRPVRLAARVQHHGLERTSAQGAGGQAEQVWTIGAVGNGPHPLLSEHAQERVRDGRVLDLGFAFDLSRVRRDLVSGGLMTLSQAGTGLARIHRPVTGAKAVVPPLASNARRGRHAHAQRQWGPDLPPRPREELVPGADAGPSRALKTRRLVVDTRRASLGPGPSDAIGSEMS